MKYKFRPFGNPNNCIEVTSTGKIYEIGEHSIYKDHKIIEVIDKDGHVHDAFLDELEVESETLEEVTKRLYPDNIIKLGNETSYNAALIKRKDFIQGVKWKLRQESKKLYSEEELKLWLVHRDAYLYNHYTTYIKSGLQLQSVEDFIKESHEYLMNRKQSKKK